MKNVSKLIVTPARSLSYNTHLGIDECLPIVESVDTVADDAWVYSSTGTTMAGTMPPITQAVTTTIKTVLIVLL